MSPGHTLLEVATIVALVAAIVAVLSPAVARQRDLATVLSAREVVVAGIAEARALAIARGGAVLRLSSSPPSLVVVTGADTVRTTRLGGASELALDLGRRDTFTLRFDEVGLGVVTSATARLSLRGVERSLVISSYGRVRRR